MNITERKPTHPGVILREDVIKPMGITQIEFAKHLGVTLETLSRLLNERSNLSPEMAVRIGEITNTSPEGWYNMQVKLDLWKVMQHKPTNTKKFSSGTLVHI